MRKNLLGALTINITTLDLLTTSDTTPSLMNFTIASSSGTLRRTLFDCDVLLFGLL